MEPIQPVQKKGSRCRAAVKEENVGHQWYVVCVSLAFAFWVWKVAESDEASRVSWSQPTTAGVFPVHFTHECSRMESCSGGVEGWTRW